MNNLARWHQAIDEANLDILDELLADNACFQSPVLYKPQEGKELTKFYLTAAFGVLVNEHFTYLREMNEGDNSCLEFRTVLDGIEINGVDLIHWTEDGQIDDFKVMVRPLKALNKIHALMAAALDLAE